MTNTLEQLLRHHPVSKWIGVRDVPVSGIAQHADQAQSGHCFVALRGSRVDGHHFIAQAVQRGATSIVCEREMPISSQVTQAVVPSSRRALADMAAQWWQHPSRELRIIGVTGTNGKTSTTYLLESIFRAAGESCGVVGTIEYRYAGRCEESSHTTPDPSTLQSLLRRMVQAGVTTCAMEISSHALEQGRVWGVDVDCALFTNLTRDHLDFHGDMRAYAAAKRRLFSEHLQQSCKSSRKAVINADDAYGQQLIREFGDDVWTYGRSKTARVQAQQVRIDAHGSEFVVSAPQGSFPLRTVLVGDFNVSNILAATTVALAYDVPISRIQSAVESMEGVPGRFERVANARGVLALVDYAHTPDALEKVLLAARQLVSLGGRLIVVFGCGGDRDREKRPSMGAVVGRLADAAVITNDNPRTEDPQQIIADIVPGITAYMRDARTTLDEDKCFICMPDRREAIACAAASARSGDVLLVAGKGHETYQLNGNVSAHFDDREELRRYYALHA